MKRNSVVTTTLAAIYFFLTAQAAHAANCTLATITGTYAYNFSGFVSPTPNVFVPAAAAGFTTFDGRGNVTGKQTRSVAGSALDETYSGTYTVTQDCVVSFTVTVAPDTRVSTVTFYPTSDLNDVYSVFTSAGFTLTGTSKRVTPR